MRVSPAPLCIAMVVAGSSVWFVVSTLVMDEIPDAALIALALLVALAFVSAFAGTLVAERVRAAGSREVARAAAAGVLTWFLPFFIVLSQRATDAPSGTETLFFTTTGWMFAAALTALAFREERPGAIQLSGYALALLGSAALLANWERPSSFSPFIKFPVQEALILVAGLVFALGLIIGRRSARALGTRSSLWIGIASATCVAVLVALPTGLGELATFDRIWPQLVLLGVALATLAIGLSGLLEGQGVARAVSWLTLTPVALTGLSALERATGVYGPNPIVWAGVVGAAILVALGITVAHTSPTAAAARALAEESPARVPALHAAIAVALAGLATALGIASLFVPAFSASASGTTGSGTAFSATWVLIGAEAAIGWLPLCVALMALAAAVGLRRRAARRDTLIAAASGAVAVAMYPLVVATPLHTWNRWIPADVQQAYGTEYARLSMDVVPHSVRFAAAGLAAAACVALLVIIVLGRDTGGAVQVSAPKEFV